MSNTLKQAITALRNRISSAYDAITRMGGVLPIVQDSANLADAIASIPAMNRAKMINRGGSLGNYTVFFDIDGTILYAFTKEEIMALSELPTPYVSHDRLTFDRWSFTLDELKSANGWRDVGAHYYPTDGFGELELDYRDSKTILTPHIGVKMRTSDGLIVDWGDGTIENLPVALEFDLSHTYAQAGKYLMRYKQANDAHIYGIYIWDDTKKHVVGRCVYPTNAECISCSSLSTQTENTTATSVQGIGGTLIEELAIPFHVFLTDGNLSSGLHCNMPCLKAVSGNMPGYVRGLNNYYSSNTGYTFFPSAIFASFNTPNPINSVPVATPSFVRSFCINNNGANKLLGIQSPNLERISTYENDVPSIKCGYPSFYSKKLNIKFKVNTGSWLNDGRINAENLEIAPDFESGFFYSRQAGGFQNCYKIRDWGTKYNGDTGTFNIGASCFANNYSLRTFTAGRGTPTIAANAFSNCYSLEELHIERSSIVDGNITTLANVNAFTNCPTSMKIYVPADSVEAYRTATNWATYSNQIYSEQL